MITSPTKKLFWIGLSALACASLLFCYKYFSVAHPFVDITLSIDRNQALEKSKSLGEHYAWPLENTRSATYFDVEQQDKLLQPFADLEGGGNDNYRALIKDKLYCPYKWFIRFFKEHSPDEVTIYLTPEGNPYGFTHTMPESTELPSLNEQSARMLAQEQAKAIWNIDFTFYKEIEFSHETKPNGRIDYSFVYERTDVTLNEEGKYRLTLKVSGDQVTEIKHSIKIPEQFERKFELLYSRNTFLANIANFLMYILYIVGGCIVGGYFLFNRNMLFAKSALCWAMLLALLNLLSSVNNLPLIWMNYQTSVSVSSFLSTYAIATFFQILQTIALCGFTFSVATSLDNWAFPHHIRFWHVWSKRNGNSYTVLGQTIGSYLSTFLLLGSTTATYVLFLNVFKWWTPTDPLVDPNIIATYIPWLSPLVSAFQAGFLEECLFRAIPLAGAVILGRYLGKERLCIIGGFFVQAFIFAAVHANYPQQPSYFRLLEIFLPATFFGIVYFIYGLLPGIICHFFYDFILMSMPLWITASASSTTQKLLLIALGFIPLIIVLIRRLQAGKWTSLEKSNYNDGPIGRVIHEPSTSQSQNVITKKTLSTITAWTMSVLGTVSLAVLLLCKQDPYNAPEMCISRTQAIEIAKQHLPSDFVFAQHYDVLTQLDNHVTPEHIFVWQTSGKEYYKKLLGTYLSQPCWNVRFVSFIAPQEIRSEEYNIFIGPDGKVIRTIHRLPEQKALPSLNKAQARGVALQALTDRYGISATEVEEISAQPTDRPNRTDWVFTFKHIPTQLTNGYAQISIAVAGSTVVDSNRSVFVPEVWQRNFMQKESVKANISMVCTLLFILLIVIAISSFGTGFLRHLKTKLFLLFALTLFTLVCLSLINSIPGLSGTFSTAQPFSTQLFTLLTTTLIFSLIRIMIVSAYTVHMRTFVDQSQLMYPGIFFIGLIGGLLLRAAHVFGKWIIPINIPVWGPYEYMASYSAFFMIGLTYTFLILRNVTFGTIAVSALNNLKESTRTRIFRFIFIFVAAYASIGTFETIASGIVIGLCITAATLILYHLLLAYDSALWIPVLTGYFLTYALSEFSSHVFPGYATGIACVGLALTCLNYWWFSRIRKNS